MAEAVVKQYDAFGVEIREPLDHTIPGFERTKLLEPVVVADEERPGCTKVIFNEVDLRAFIHEAAQNCGLAYVLQMMKTGQIMPADIADDGAHGVDLSDIPEYIGDLKRKTESSTGEAAKTLAALGIDPAKTYTEEELTAAIQNALKPYFEKPKDGDAE